MCVVCCIRVTVTSTADDVFEICGSFAAFRYETYRSGVIEGKGLEIQPIRAKELECLMANQSRSPGGMQHVPPSFLVISFNNAVCSASRNTSVSSRSLRSSDISPRWGLSTVTPPDAQSELHPPLTFLHPRPAPPPHGTYPNVSGSGLSFIL